MAWATQCPPRKRGICWLARGGRGPLMWVGLTREAVSGEEALGSGAEKRASEKEGAGGAAPCEGACESCEERVPTSPAEIRGKRTSKFPISTVAFLRAPWSVLPIFRARARVLQDLARSGEPATRWW